MNQAKGSILVVDDEESIRTIVARKLKTEGYNCVVVSDGKEAIETASTQDFDLVITDIKMPGLTGMEVLSQMIADHTDTAVIMITAVSSAQTAVEAMKLGAYDYVTKPFDLNDLSVRIEKALERRRLAIENRDYQLHLEQKIEHHVSQIQEYYREAIQSLANEDIALEILDKVRRKKCGEMKLGADDATSSHELTGTVREFVGKLSQSPGTEEKNDFESALEMARALALMAEMREPYARGHSERVNMLANEIALQIGFSEASIKDLQLAAVLHDTGKIVIPDHILFKPGSLTPAEHNEVKRHPSATVEIIRHMDYFKEIIPLVESHHEWYNGKGYPNKLKGERIPLGARILAVADAYDAMTCPRPYRPRLSNEEAVQVLKSGSGTQWDPAVVDAFLQILERESRMLQEPLNAQSSE